MIGNKKYQDYFFGADAIFTTMKYAFEELNFERLDGGIIEYNKKSLKLFCSKILGWEIEGRRKNYFYHKGSFWHQDLIGITKEKYKEVKNTQKKYSKSIKNKIP
jgi:RimJ/RimL family protein N-acetyltransferase